MNKVSTAAIVRVGDGRGFVVQGPVERLIITAAHCLPELPPCHGASYLEERTYGNLIGQLGTEPDISAECVFADPVSDLAVLGPPDGQVLSEEYDAYEAFTEAAEPLAIGEVAKGQRLWALSLQGEWFACEPTFVARAVVIGTSASPIVNGMSGSPFVTDDGAAVSVVCLGKGTNPRLTYSLPAGLLEAILA